jgi:hypothetical protein
MHILRKNYFLVMLNMIAGVAGVIVVDMAMLLLILT